MTFIELNVFLSICRPYGLDESSASILSPSDISYDNTEDDLVRRNDDHFSKLVLCLMLCDKFSFKAISVSALKLQLFLKIPGQITCGLQISILDSLKTL